MDRRCFFLPSSFSLSPFLTHIFSQVRWIEFKVVILSQLLLQILISDWIVLGCSGLCASLRLIYSLLWHSVLPPPLRQLSRNSRADEFIPTAEMHSYKITIYGTYALRSSFWCLSQCAIDLNKCHICSLSFISPTDLAFPDKPLSKSSPRPPKSITRKCPWLSCASVFNSAALSAGTKAVPVDMHLPHSTWINLEILPFWHNSNIALPEANKWMHLFFSLSLYFSSHWCGVH